MNKKPCDRGRGQRMKKRMSVPEKAINVSILSRFVVSLGT
jgi:hypothetical protein